MKEKLKLNPDNLVDKEMEHESALKYAEKMIKSLWTKLEEVEAIEDSDKFAKAFLYYLGIVDDVMSDLRRIPNFPNVEERKRITDAFWQTFTDKLESYVGDRLQDLPESSELKRFFESSAYNLKKMGVYSPAYGGLKREIADEEPPISTEPSKIQIIKQGESCCFKAEDGFLRRGGKEILTEWAALKEGDEMQKKMKEVLFSAGLLGEYRWVPSQESKINTTARDYNTCHQTTFLHGRLIPLVTAEETKKPPVPIQEQVSASKQEAFETGQALSPDEEKKLKDIFIEYEAQLVELEKQTKTSNLDPEQLEAQLKELDQRISEFYSQLQNQDMKEHYVPLRRSSLLNTWWLERQERVENIERIIRDQKAKTEAKKREEAQMREKQKFEKERQKAEAEKQAQEDWPNVLEIAKTDLKNLWISQEWRFGDRADYFQSSNQYPEEVREIMSKKEKQAEIKRMVNEEARDFYQEATDWWFDKLQGRLESVTSYQDKVDKLQAATVAFANGFKEDSFKIHETFDKLLSDSPERGDVFNCIEAQAQGRIIALGVRAIKDAELKDDVFRLPAQFDLLAAIKAMQDTKYKRMFAIIPATRGGRNIIDDLKYLDTQHSRGDRVYQGLISTNTCVNDNNMQISQTAYGESQMRLKENALSLIRVKVIEEHMPLLNRLRVGLKLVYEADKHNRNPRGSFVKTIDKFVAANGVSTLNF